MTAWTCSVLCFDGLQATVRRLQLAGHPAPHMDEAYCKLLSKERTQIKRVVFGIPYGAGPKKIAEQIGVSAEEGQKLIDMFHDVPAIRDYIDEVNIWLRDGYVDTIFNRRRRFPLQATSRHRGRAERQACNFKIQSTSSDIVIARSPSRCTDDQLG